MGKVEYKDMRENTRKLGVALCGEENAAGQASLCDLIHVAAGTRKRLEAAENTILAVEAALTEGSPHFLAGITIMQYWDLYGRPENG